MNETTLPTYGARARFGPWHRQGVRWIGRTLESIGQRLDSWSWGGNWTPRIQRDLVSSSQESPNT